jgi:hypothetical protein
MFLYFYSFCNLIFITLVCQCFNPKYFELSDFLFHDYYTLSYPCFVSSTLFS